MKKPLPSQISDDDAGDQAGADAGALHVGLEVRPPPSPPPLPRAPPPLPPNRPLELAVEVAPELVEVGRALVAAAGRCPPAARRAGRPAPRRARRRAPARIVRLNMRLDRRRLAEGSCAGSGMGGSCGSACVVRLVARRIVPDQRRRRADRRPVPRRPAARRRARRDRLRELRARSSARPSPVRALTKTRGTQRAVELDTSPSCARPLRRVERVDLVEDEDLRHVGGADLVRARAAPRRSARRWSRVGASTTCSSRSASAASCSVAWNAATRSCGRSRMKPTVSDSDDRAPRVLAGRAGASSCRASRTAGRRRRPRALTSALNSVDLPALV